MIAMTLLTSRLVSVAICVLLAIYKRHPILLWALLGAVLPVSAPIVILCAPRLKSTESPTGYASPVFGWILLAAGAVAMPQMLIGLGFSVNSSQLRTSALLLLLTIGAIVGGSVILRRRTPVKLPSPALTPIERALHRIAALAVVLWCSLDISSLLAPLLQRRIDGLSLIWVSLLPIVLAVYLLQGRRFARPLLIALSIYALPLEIGLLTGLGWHNALRASDARATVQTSARFMALTALIIAALLEYWRRRTSSGSDGMALETAT